MRIQRTLLLTGLAAFCLSLLLLVPARILSPLLTSSGVPASGLSGTIWSGSARTLTAGPLRLDQVSWQFEPWQLLRGELGVHVEAQLPDGFFSGHVSRSLSGRLVVRDIEAAAPLGALSPGMASMTGNSQLSVRMQQLAWFDGWVETAIGTVQLSEVVLPIPVLAGRTPPGNYVLSFDSESLAAGAPLAGKVSDGGGPLEINGLLNLSPPRNYELTATVKARENAPAELVNILQSAGPRAAGGGREFSLAGSF
ncbi:MAG: type II secretion system protein N [Gammaproteobacteria bacterium]|nr:type II secretion system protein N [Gammaproteobacteria bacterium]